MNENQNNEMLPEEVTPTTPSDQNVEPQVEQTASAEPAPEIVAEQPELATSTVPFAPDTSAKPAKKTTSGIKVFVSMVAIVAIICICLTVGYVAGRNFVIPDNTNSAPVGVVSKPKDGNTMTAAEIYEQVSKSIVGIIVYNESGIQGSASGVVFKDGYIITNDHIYDEVVNARFIIVDSEGNEHDAYYVAGDLRSDVAVLQTQANLPAAEFGDSNEIIVGEDAMAIGCPAGPYEKAIFTVGTISSRARRITGSKTTYSTKMIQTDSAINPGSSGGALVNSYGQVVGITSAKTAGTYYDSIGYAIPSNTAVDVANKLIKYGYVKGRAVVGVSYTENTTVDQKTTGARVGLVVQSITPGGPMASTGVRVGDVIIAINDIPVTRGNDVLDVIESLEAGDTIMLTVYSSSSGQKNVTVTLGEDKGSSSYVTEE